MDPKASAKSKRAHTQHGRANHPSPSAIAQRKKHGNSKDKNPTQGGGDGEPKRSRAPALPSNWGRYGEEEEEELNGAGNPATTEVAPKSKGADFGYLLEQARTQQQERRNLAARGLSASSSSEEFPLGLMQGLSSMLLVRGKGLLSLCEDDNFIIDDDDDTPSSYECVDESNEKQISERPEDSVASDIKHDYVPSTTMNVDGQNNPSNHYRGSEIDEGALLKKHHSQLLSGNITKFHPTKELRSQEFSPSRITQGSNSNLSIYAVSNPMENTTSAAAEAELDMLLDSLSGTSFSGAASDDLINDVSETSLSLKDKNYKGSTVKEEALHSKVQAPPTFGSKSADQSSSLRTQARTALDDAVDDLFGEKSVFSEDQKREPSAISLPSRPPFGSKPMDDFDSWLDTL
ncbi:hypothetical protein MUK42_06048 [Musa troglodytarum]|uniref:Uncharacterized protein n=1 Tax=Musa troglodytarum TaxID=320322 RepID=A0A9E7L244_9LILI|nr:hypothetical protein MUK42_06048 [Musa troglodytarum]